MPTDAGNTALFVESTPIMATKKIEVNYPLSRLSEPVVTRLVTDFDLSPNLLRADVDAAKGGWLVMELTGDDARIASAMEWLRGQGLTVSEEV